MDVERTRHSHPGTPKIRFVTKDVAIGDGDSYMAAFPDEHRNELPSIRDTPPYS
jgi:hypothetical protein